MVICQENDGDFRHKLRYRIAVGDVKFKENVKSASANSTYLSKTIQNELLEIMGHFVQQKIAIRVKKSQSMVF